MYAATVFFGAFLLFLVQPLAGRYVLPWFGGGASVWSACLVFFQSALLLGYALAHLGVERARPRIQAALVLGAIVTALLFLPIAPHRPAVESAVAPALRILGLLAVSIGAPFVLLATVGPLLQAWRSRLEPDVPPWRLFAVSNAGSLLALLAYPVAVEPALGLGRQSTAFSIAFAVFCLSLAACALRLARSAGATGPRDMPVPRAEGALLDPSLVPAPDPGAPERPRAGLVLLWLALAAFPALALVAITSQLCRDVAAVPFLWILPLAIYLITFIVAFGRERGYERLTFTVMLALTMVLAVRVMGLGSDASLLLQVVGLVAVLFACAMTCHGELARARPAPRHLTLYYLVVASGGALGGMFAALVAPVAFDDLHELPIALVGCVAAVVWAWLRDPSLPLMRAHRASIGAGLAVVVTVLAGAFVQLALARNADVIHRVRGFYGVLSVLERSAYDADGGLRARARVLMNGTIKHGQQFVGDERRLIPTSYFGAESGIDVAIRLHPRREVGAMRIGVIGLGVGTIAAYGRPGDVVRFYEINPDVVDVARGWFTYLADSKAEVQIALGDARLVMERELATRGPQQFDVLAVDAFSSDAIPIHLLTRECMDVYFRHLKADGILAIHVSNRFLDLAPVVRSLAEDDGHTALLLQWAVDEDDDVRDANTWVLVTDNHDFARDIRVGRRISPWPQDMKYVPWSDDFHALWDVLRRRS